MSTDGTEVIAPLPRRRPQYVASLLQGGEVHPSWNFANQRLSRFFVVNLEVVLGNIPGISITQTAPYFAEAADVIKNETEWPKQHPFTYTCSHTQIFRDNMRVPKTFGRAATITVAVELMAAEKAPGLCVYDSLRILAADQFPDYFDEARLKQLEEFYDKMEQAEKERRFGRYAQRSFEEVCLTQIEQNRHGLLAALAAGGCVTRYTADKLCRFIEANFPGDLHIGPILSAGQDAHCPGLGSRPTVEGLQVPRRIDPTEFKPWS